MSGGHSARPPVPAGPWTPAFPRDAGSHACLFQLRLLM